MVPVTRDGRIDRIGWVHMLEGVEVEVIRRQPRYTLSGENINNGDDDNGSQSVGEPLARYNNW